MLEWPIMAGPATPTPLHYHIFKLGVPRAPSYRVSVVMSEDSLHFPNLLAPLPPSDMHGKIAP